MTMAKERTIYTEILYDISTLFQKEQEFQVLLEKILELLGSRLHVLRGMISIYDEERQQIHLDAAYGYSSEEMERGVYEPGEGIIGSVVATGEPIVVPSVKNEPRFLNRTGARPASDDDTISFISVPISLLNKVIGSVSVDILNSDAMPLDEELRLLTTISIMIAHAVNSRRELRLHEMALQEENRRLKVKLSMEQKPLNIIGNSHEIQDLSEKILLVAETDSTVLITGESGTGKELVADAIHYHSNRSDKPFIKVNVAALPDNLIESELFGHERGAFTGAVQQKKGRFELAHGGTIFLDEIGDLSQHLQVHLLRVLQERTIERIGGIRTIPLDVRIIAATHQKLEERIADGTFRSDLYYRLNVFPVYVPPLRDRKADIVMLSDYFLERYSVRYSRNVKRISSDALDLLTAYHWPGNVRELENAIERAVVMTQEDAIRAFHLPPSLQFIDDEEREEGLSLEELTNRFQRELIIDQLKLTGGNITRAAEQLGTTKRILNYRLHRLGIDYRRFR